MRVLEPRHQGLAEDGRGRLGCKLDRLDLLAFAALRDHGDAGGTEVAHPVDLAER